MSEEIQETQGDATTEAPSEEQKSAPSNLNLGGSATSPSSDADLDIETPEVEDVKPSTTSGIVGRIRERLNIPTGETEVKPKPKPKKMTKREQGELMDAARTLLTPLLIIAITASLSEACAPTTEEADAFVEPIARIIGRHVQLPDYISADVLDMLSMAAAGVVWYQRVSPELPWNKEDRGKGPGRGGRDNGRGPAGGAEEELTPVEKDSVFSDEPMLINDFLPRSEGGAYE